MKQETGNEKQKTQHENIIKWALNNFMFLYFLLKSIEVKDLIETIIHLSILILS